MKIFSIDVGYRNLGWVVINDNLKLLECGLLDMGPQDHTHAWQIANKIVKTNLFVRMKAECEVLVIEEQFQVPFNIIESILCYWWCAARGEPSVSRISATTTIRYWKLKRKDKGMREIQTKELTNSEEWNSIIQWKPRIHDICDAYLIGRMYLETALL